MKPGDLVRIRTGRARAGDVGVVIGPSKGSAGEIGFLDVLFNDGILLTLPTSLVRVRKAKGVIHEAR